MKLVRLLPLILGVIILIFGIYLVSSHGTVFGVYLPGLIGLPNCSPGSNNTSCGFSPVGTWSVGTIVAITGIGFIMAGLRSVMSSASMSGGSMTSMPPEMAASMEMARTRMATMTQPPSPSVAPAPVPPGPAIRPDTKYCSKCGKANAIEARFCQACGSTMPPSP